MLKITVKEIIEANQIICSEYRNDHGIRDRNLLLSIPEGVNQSVFGEDAYPTIEDKIAFVVASIAKNHIFFDGNKRTASMIYIGLCDDYSIPSKSDDTLFDIILKIAEHKFDIEHAKNLLF